MDSPFEAGHVRQIGMSIAGREAREEVRECRAVLRAARALRRLSPDECVGGIGEEAPVHQPTHDGIGGLKHRRQGRKNVVPVYCEPGARGDTATNVTKPVKLETGAEINAPLFIQMGNVLKIDTRTGEYIERVST